MSIIDPSLEDLEDLEDRARRTDQNTTQQTTPQHGMTHTLTICFSKNIAASSRTFVAQSNRISCSDKLEELASITTRDRTEAGRVRSNFNNRPATCKYELTMRMATE